MTNQTIYRWVPRNGASLDAIERMAKHFRKPQHPMGEAWFMSKERRFFHELAERPFEDIPTNEISHILFEIASGTSSFGHREEWDEWFKYLLPNLINRSSDFEFVTVLHIQSVVSTFMNIYWNGIVEEYQGFRADVIDTLSLCLMNDELWFDHKDEIAGETYPTAMFLAWEKEDGRLRMDWNANEANENLSAMMFFCLKYLNPEEIMTWVKSLLSIRDPYFRGTLMVWLLGAFDLLHEPVVVPSKIEKAKPKIRWGDSHVLGSSYGSVDAEYPPMEGYNDNKDFLPHENTATFLEEIRRQLTAEVILDWAESFSYDQYAAESTYNVPELLFDKLVGNKGAA